MNKSLAKLIIALALAVVLCGTVSAEDNNTVSIQTANAQVPFIENQGQIENSSVKYYAQTFTGTAYATNSSVTYALASEDEGWTVKESFIDINEVNVQGQTASNTTVNYFVGDSENWKTNIPTYNQIEYQNIYNGIDLNLKAYNNNIEKIFVIGTNGNPSDIKIQVEGSQGISVNENGELEILTGIGTLKMTKPVAYQLIDGQKIGIPVSYLVNGTVYGFNVGEYNKSYLLYIDPLLASTFVGSSNGDYGYGIITDSSGNVFIVGQARSTDFPTTTGAYDTTLNGSYDIFVSKFNSDLNLVASTYLGGSAQEYGGDITVDQAGNIFVFGNTLSTNFPVTAGAYDTIYNGGYDVFVSKFNNDLSSLTASTYLGGSITDYSADIIVDKTGNIYVTGPTNSNNFPVTAGAYDITYNGDPGDSYISKLDNSLSSLLASTYLGGSPMQDYTIAIALDQLGNVFTTGWTRSNDFPTTVGAYDTKFDGNIDIFVSKFNDDLSNLLASTLLGGSTDGSYEEPEGIVISQSGNVFITGETMSNDFPTTTGAYDTTYNYSGTKYWDTFISKFNSELSTLEASTYLGGGYFDMSAEIVLDQSENVFIAGHTGSSDFPVTTGAYDTTYNFGNSDNYITKLNSDLSQLLASTYIGGNGYDTAYGITIDQSGNIYITGETSSSNYPTTTGSFDTSYNGNSDAFISKLDNSLSKPNLPPLLGNIGNKVIDEAQTLSFTVNALDPEGNTLSYTVTGLPQGAIFNQATRTFTWSPSYNQAGIYQNIVFTVSDGFLTDSETISITVNNINRNPVANAGTDQNMYIEDLVTLDGSASSDPDGEALTYTWSLIKPEGSSAALSDPASINPTFTPDVPGDYIAQLTVNDVNGGSSTDIATITAKNPNSPPIADPDGPYVAYEGSPITFDGSTSTDPDGDTLTYEWDLDGDGTFETPGMTVTKTWNDDYSGTISLKVTDSKGASDIASTTVTVQNAAPTVNINDSYYVKVPITMRVSGAKGNSVEIQIIQDNKVIASEIIIRNAGSPNEQEVTFYANIDMSKPYTGRLIFNTESDLSGAMPVWLIIDGKKTKVATFNTQKNNPASYNQVYNFPLKGLFTIVGKEITFKAEAFDPGTDLITFEWNAGGIQAPVIHTYTSDGINPVIDSVTFTFTEADNYVIILRVRDDEGAERVYTKTISVV